MGEMNYYVTLCIALLADFESLWRYPTHMTGIFPKLTRLTATKQA